MAYANMYERIAASFARQGFPRLIGIALEEAEYGKVVLSCPFNEQLTQQTGFFHGGVLATLADNAAGYAALTVMPEDAEVLSVEFKINMLRPARADKIYATGTVLKGGKRLVVSEALVTDAARSTLYAKLQATMIVLPHAAM